MTDNALTLICCVTFVIFIVWFICMSLLYRNRRRSITYITKQCKYIFLLMLILETISILIIEIITLH